jgi:hypothetical protein
MRKLYERVAAPCAMRSTKGAWLAGRRLMAVDGFGMEAPDSEENATGSASWCYVVEWADEYASA